MPLLEVRELTKTYIRGGGLLSRSGEEETRAVDSISLDIFPGETLGLVGESGCGKTTLGRMLLRLIEPTSGTIRFDGRSVLNASGAELRRLRRNMQIVFQDPFASLNPRLRVFDMVREPWIIRAPGIARPGPKSATQRTRRAVPTTTGTTQPEMRSPTRRSRPA